MQNIGFKAIIRQSLRQLIKYVNKLNEFTVDMLNMYIKLQFIINKDAQVLAAFTLLISTPFMTILQQSLVALVFEKTDVLLRLRLSLFTLSHSLNLFELKYTIQIFKE